MSGKEIYQKMYDFFLSAYSVKEDVYVYCSSEERNICNGEKNC